MTLYADAVPGPTRKRGVIIMMGQSNTNNKGSVSDLTGGDVVYGVINPAVKYCERYYEAVGDPQLNISWESLQPISGTLGMEMSIGYNVTPGDYAIIKFWIGGSSMADWRAQGYHVEGSNYVKSQMVSLGETCYPLALVWIQGEAETSLTVPMWPSTMTMVVNTVRQTLGRMQLPVYVVETQQTTGIKTAQIAWVASDPHATLINTDAYPYEAPPHWLVPSVCDIGELIATQINLLPH